jgi:hypothetical protein
MNDNKTDIERLTETVQAMGNFAQLSNVLARYHKESGATDIEEFKECLERELGDILASVDSIVSDTDLSMEAIEARATATAGQYDGWRNKAGKTIRVRIEIAKSQLDRSKFVDRLTEILLSFVYSIIGIWLYHNVGLIAVLTWMVAIAPITFALHFLKCFVQDRRNGFKGEGS